MMFESKIRQRLAAGETLWGCGLSGGSELAAKCSVDSGADFVWIDLEHNPSDINEIRWLPILCRLRSCPAIIRVPDLQAGSIKKALDIGASGVIIPQINNADQAKRAVDYCRYAPQGNRGVSPWWTLLLNVPLEDYLPAANDETCVIVQIETEEGIRNIDSIGAVEGVDILFAGPLDLSSALGHIGQIEHPQVQQFLADFPKRIEKPAGIALGDPEKSKAAYDQGYRFIVCGNLLFYGMKALEGELEKLRAHEQNAVAGR